LGRAAQLAEVIARYSDQCIGSLARDARVSFALTGDGLTFNKDYVQSNIMGVARLQDALERLTAVIRDVETELAAMKAEHDPLASHIFISRRQYRDAHDTKGGKRREINARLSFNTACELGFRGSLDDGNVLWGQSRGDKRGRRLTVSHNKSCPYRPFSPRWLC
jgi:hypothetical protein